MTAEIIPFNPLDTSNLGAAVAEAMLAGAIYPLDECPDFFGAGIYAIYYTGPSPAYQEISIRNANGLFTAPIYIGKAVPAGARRGIATATGSKTRALSKRLAEHRESIRAVANLEIKDFHCRFLVVEDIWIPLGESLLISRYAPVWNAVVDGFGNHDPGSGRYNGLRPRWDVLHSGRAWADKCRVRPETSADIEREVQEYLRNAPFPTSDRFISPVNVPKS